MKWCHQTAFMQTSRTSKTAWYAAMYFMAVQQGALIYLDTRKEGMDITMRNEISVGIMEFQLYWHVTMLKNKSLRR